LLILLTDISRSGDIAKERSIFRMINRKLLGLIFFLLANISANGQTTTYSICSINKVTSKNGKFFLRSTPFDNIEQSPAGKTIVYTSDSTKIYELPRYFEVSDNRKEIYLSNDGNTVAYIVDRELEWYDIYQKAIELYRRGEEFKGFTLDELIKCNKEVEDCHLFYKDAIDTVKYVNGKRNVLFKETATDFEKNLTNRAVYFSNDTLTIFSRTSVIRLDLNSGKLFSEDFTAFAQEDVKQMDTLSFQSIDFKSPSLYGMPRTVDNKSVEEGLAEFLDMRVYPEDSRKSDKYKRYSAYIELMIDTTGSAYLDKIENHGNLPEDKINSFISGIQFETDHIPSGIEKWRFSGWVKLMNKSKKVAKRERKKELEEEREAYKKRVAADSINGLYIPKNLEECFVELNKTLKKKYIDVIKNLKSRDETILYHHGLGTWIRNNWGFWGGSRLQQYLLKKGIKHPDSMSALILEYYYDWLNDDNRGWIEFESK
jgi:hypothetical protein